MSRTFYENDKPATLEEILDYFKADKVSTEQLFEPGDFEKDWHNPARGNSRVWFDAERAAEISNTKLAALGIDAETPRLLHEQSVLIRVMEERAQAAEQRLTALGKQLAEAPKCKVLSGEVYWESGTLPIKDFRCRLVDVKVIDYTVEDRCSCDDAFEKNPCPVHEKGREA